MLLTESSSSVSSMVRSITSDSVVDVGRNNAMYSRDVGSRELRTREASTDELGVEWDGFDDAMKGGCGDAGSGTLCCVDR